MPRTRFTATEKLDILLGLAKTNLAQSAYFKSYGIARDTFIRWQRLYTQGGLDGLRESIAVILSSGNTENSAHLNYLVVMDFLVNVIKDIGYFCARKPRAFLGFRFPLEKTKHSRHISKPLIMHSD
ncbi:helix-turn-helix domain-containing protein, partial [Lactiplantibacillus argentoratensis]